MLLFSRFSLTTQIFCNILICRYCVNDATQSYSCFRCEIKYQIVISVQTVSDLDLAEEPPNLLL